MRNSDEALGVIDSILELLEVKQYGTAKPETKRHFEALTSRLGALTAEYLPGDTLAIYLGEQVGKLNEYKDHLCMKKRPLFWMSHEACRLDMVSAALKARGLIERHAREYEEKSPVQR